jgi:hypothetical protein
VDFRKTTRTEAGLHGLLERTKHLSGGVADMVLWSWPMYERWTYMEEVDRWLGHHLRAVTWGSRRGGVAASVRKWATARLDWSWAESKSSRSIATQWPEACAGGRESWRRARQALETSCGHISGHDLCAALLAAFVEASFPMRTIRHKVPPRCLPLSG